MSYNDRTTQLHRRIAIGLGSAAGGLLAAAFLPMATAHAIIEADLDPFSDAGFTDGRTLDALLSPTIAAQLDAIVDNTNISISFDGVTLLQLGSAAADSGRTGDLAIAIGANSIANAGIPLIPGQFDIAFADGANSIAASGLGQFDDAFASGANSVANAGGSADNLSNGDFASAFGTDTAAIAGTQATQVPSGNDIALAFDPTGSAPSSALAVQGNFDLAEVFGAGSLAEAGMIGNFDLGAALADGVTSTGATGGSFLVDIVP
jgi:hypothetical protein